MTRIALAIAGLAAAVLLTLAPASAATLEKMTVETASGPHEFMVEIAVSEEQREVGLMYRRSLPADRGMLFDFGRTDDAAMWMKNTYLPLDMLFLDEAGRVAHIATNAEPLSTRIIPSGGPVRYVVELLAGAADRIGVRTGDRVIQARIGS